MLFLLLIFPGPLLLLIILLIVKAKQPIGPHLPRILRPVFYVQMRLQLVFRPKCNIAPGLAYGIGTYEMGPCKVVLQIVVARVIYVLMLLPTDVTG